MDLTSSKERAAKLDKLVTKFKVFMLCEDMSYSDKVAVITFISEKYFKILHTYKINDSLYSNAKEQLLPAIESMKDEETIDATFASLLHYLELLSKALRGWL